LYLVTACVQSCAQLYPSTCRPPRPVAICSGASSNTSYFIDAMLSLFDKHGCSEEAVSPRCWRHPPDPRVGRIAEPTRSTPRPPSHLSLGDLVRRRSSSRAAGDLATTCILSLPLSRERGGRARSQLCILLSPIPDRCGKTLATGGDWTMEPSQCAYPPVLAASTLVWPLVA
jgi:hypothetical protein